MSHSYLIKFLIISDCKKNVTWCDSTSVGVSGRIASQLHNLSYMYTPHREIGLKFPAMQFLVTSQHAQL